MPAGRALHILKILAGAAELRGDAAGAAIEAVAEFGKPHAAGSALQKADAELFFQQAQALAEGGLRSVEAPGGAAQAAAFDHINEALELLLVHT